MEPDAVSRVCELMSHTPLTRRNVAFVCPMKWEDLAPTSDAGARYCDRCAMDVVDLRGCSMEHARDLKRQRGGKLCGMISVTGTAVALTVAGAAPASETAAEVESAATTLHEVAHAATWGWNSGGAVAVKHGLNRSAPGPDELIVMGDIAFEPAPQKPVDPDAQ